MQHFSTADLEGLEGYMKDEIANDISDGKVTHLHLHSYNASQHFKSSGAIEYFTSLINDCGGATDCMYVYSFWAPCRGKEFFDGLGGALEKKHNLIKVAKTGGDTIAGTNSGYIWNLMDAHDALKYYFENCWYGLSKTKSENKVNKFKFFKYLTHDNTIIQTEETFKVLEKINSCY